MREILFRGKTDKGEWVQGVPFVEEERCYIIEDLFICDEYDCTGAVNSMVIPETVGQYTGLTDKNGKKIFEGDIVYEYNARGERSAQKYVVMWEEIFVRWSIAECRSMYGSKNIANYEVVGNIHDNPEFLKGATDEES